ncbi:MAG: S41 family peptidase [Bacteroidales bacterium]|nr:S41 family peptidase [Bacteroidales bacterium]
MKPNSIRTKVFATVLLFLTTAPLLAQKKITAIDLDQQLRKLVYVESAIAQLYVDTVNINKLTEDAIRGMLTELDPHSTYTTAKDVQAMNEPLSGSFEGVGVQFNMREDTLLVIQPVSGGPSEKVGIMAGDLIVTINDTSIAGVKMSSEEIMRRLRGPKGSSVNLGVVRRGVKGIQKFTVKRDKIPVYTIDAYYMIDPTTGYIHISNVGATTNEEFVKATTELISLGMQDLVIDLQGNPGGYLQAAVDISDHFLENNEMIVYTEGRVMGRQEYHAQKGKLALRKIVALVDGYTASAAEIISGALQDNDRGIIVGRRTFAKGLVQRSIALPDGAEMRLTVAHYYSPVGRSFQKPYVKGNKKKYDMDMLDRLNSGELTNADSIHFPDSLKYTTKAGRIVYGGGGIMPDVYVPLDTTRYTELHRQIAAKGIANTTILKWVDINRKKMIKAYNVDAYKKARTRQAENKKFEQKDLREGFNRFKQDFVISQDIIDMLKQQMKEENIEYTDLSLQATMPILGVQLKALVARDIWSTAEYYEIINPLSDIFKKGLEALKDEKLFQNIQTN